MGRVAEADAARDARDLLPGVPLVHSPFFEAVVAGSDWDDETRRVARDLNRDGFAVIDFQEPQFDALVEDVGREVFEPLPWERWRTGELHELRVAEAWQVNESVRRLAANAHVIDLLSRIYGRQAFPFQTLNFGSGSQQPAHVDLAHFASSPELFMAGVWLALEDVAEDAGELFYYPGSHHWPVFHNDHVGRAPAREDDPYADHDRLDRAWAKLRETYGVEPRLFRPRKGQALIWAAGLHHGGAPHRDRRRSRLSQVTHYFFEDCAYWTPLMSDPFAGRIAYRTGLRNIATGEPVVNRPGGRPTPADFIRAAGGAAESSLLQRLAGRWRRLGRSGQGDSAPRPR